MIPLQRPLKIESISYTSSRFSPQGKYWLMACTSRPSDSMSKLAYPELEASKTMVTPRLRPKLRSSCSTINAVYCSPRYFISSIFRWNLVRRKSRPLPSRSNDPLEKAVPRR
ncbi:hypothetical protein TYRP_013959 [Tyrophagus putrescentiae]|nr:hypothetical protein TYRP_013959 [Tyrophagus putrescentiae]